MAKMQHYNRGPGQPAADLPSDAVKREFGRRLQAKLDEKGWNQSELARRAAYHMRDSKFGRDNVSNYIRGRVLPTPQHLHALSLALECESTDLLPTRGVPSVDAVLPPIEIRSSGPNTAWVRVNQELPWTVAVQILQLVKGQEWNTSQKPNSPEPPESPEEPSSDGSRKSA